MSDSNNSNSVGLKEWIILAFVTIILLVILSLNNIKSLLNSHSYLFYAILFVYIIFVNKIFNKEEGIAEIVLNPHTWISFIIISLLISKEIVISLGEIIKNIFISFNVADVVYVLYIAGFLITIFGILLLVSSIFDIINSKELNNIRDFVNNLLERNNVENLQREFRNNILERLNNLEESLSDIEEELINLNETVNRLNDEAAGVNEILFELTSVLNNVIIREEGGIYNIYIIDNGGEVYITSVNRR